MQLDVRDQSAVEKAFTTLPASWEAIDVLVNNAGLSRGLDRLHEGKLLDWEEMIDTNIKGLLYVSRAVLPGMVKRASGTVINIGSIAGHDVYPGGNVYCATKHAVDAITRCLRMDLVDTLSGCARSTRAWSRRNSALCASGEMPKGQRRCTKTCRRSRPQMLLRR